MGVVTRAEVWWIDFGVPVGSEPGYRRPALIVSSDRFNRSRLATAIVSAITSDTRLAQAPGNVALPNGAAGLEKDSVVNVSQTLVVDRRRLLRRSGALEGATMRDVDAGLRLLLAL